MSERQRGYLKEKEKQENVVACKPSEESVECMIMCTRVADRANESGPWC